MKFNAVFIFVSFLLDVIVFAKPIMPQIPYGAIASIENTQTLAGKDEAPGGVGSGVLIKSSGLLLTNIHVIVACFDALGEKDPWRPTSAVIGKTCPKENIKISFPMAQGKPSLRGAKILAVGKPMADSPDALSADWVLLSIDPDLIQTVPAVRLSTQEISDHDPIYIAGFPSSPVGTLVTGAEKMYETSGTIEPAAAVEAIWKKIYTSLLLTPDQFTDIFTYAKANLFNSSAVFFHNALIIGGYSGSPAFNKTGEMVGLVFGNASVWKYDYGDYPVKSLGADASQPDKPTNRMSTGIRMSAIVKALQL